MCRTKHCLSPISIAVHTEVLRRIWYPAWEKTELNSYFVLHIAEPTAAEQRAKAEKKWCLGSYVGLSPTGVMR